MLSHGLNTLISVFVRQISLAFDSDWFPDIQSFVF
jgi:hypothetical protein